MTRPYKCILKLSGFIFFHLNDWIIYENIDICKKVIFLFVSELIYL